MTDSFENKNLHLHGHDIDNSSMPLHMGDGNAEIMPLFLQSKAGIPHVTNWDDAANSVSKTDRSYFVDQQANNCGNPKDIVIKDDICVVGYPDHTATIKTEIDVSSSLNKIYALREDNIPTCYEGNIVDGGSQVTYIDMNASILDYQLNTPEIEDLPSDPENEQRNKHTYFYDTYLKVTIDSEDLYYQFRGFMASSEFVTRAGMTNDSCGGDNNDRLTGSGWYYLTDTNKIGILGSPLNVDVPSLSTYNSGGFLIYRTIGAVSDSQNCSTCENCSACGENEICELCTSSSAMYAHTIGVEASLIKATSFENCGKIDIYHKKSGKIESINNNEITSTDHDLSDYDILKISDEFGDANVVSDINGVVYARVIDNNTFTIFSDPRTDEAGSVPDFAIDTSSISDTASLKWTCVGNSQKEEFQSWQYYGSFGSSTGLNGYNIELPSINYGGNYQSLNTGESIDAITATEGYYNLNFKSSNDYPAKGYFGHSLDIIKVDGFYVLAVGEPGSNVTYERLTGANGDRQQLVPSSSNTGRVHFYRLDTDINSQISNVGAGGYVRALNQPWEIVEDLISGDGSSLLTNPSTIIDAIDLADAAVNENRWLEISANPNQNGTGRSFVWSDRFGRGVGMGHEGVSYGSNDTYYTSGISSLYRHEIFNILLSTTGVNLYNVSTYTLSQTIEDNSRSMRDGIQYNYEKLCFGTEDGILCYDYADPAGLNNDVFSLATTISIPPDANSSEFGSYIAQYGDYILTNSSSTKNEFGNVSVNECHYVYVYKKQFDGRYKLLQKIAPCVQRDDPFYNDLTVSELNEVGLTASDNLSYGGLSEDTYTWTNYDLTGKYDIYKNKIIFRDPFEYVVFKDNWNTEVKNPLSGAISPENYFFFRERYNSDNLGTVQDPFIGYSYDSNFDGSVSVVESYYRHDTLVLLFDIPRFQGYVNVYNSLNVRLNIDRNGAQDDAPMLIFYPNDPRDTISSVTNMPAVDGASNYGTSYDLGTYNSGNFTLEDDGSYTVDIDIDPSVFLNGLIEGDITDAFDQAQDSYNDTGTVHKTLALGIKVRRRDDSRIAPYTVDGDRLNNGNFYESNAQVQDVTLRLSYSLYEEKSLRRFDLASRKLAIPNISESQTVESLSATVGEIGTGSQIRMGNSFSNAYIDESSNTVRKGMYSESLQIFESFGSVYSSDIYLDNNDDLTVLNNASRTYSEKTTTASLDIQSPEFLSLYIRSNLTDTGNMPLYMQGHISDSGSVPMFVKGIAFDTQSLPLTIGPLTNSNLLNLSMPEVFGTKTAGMPLVGPKLKGYEVPPTGTTLTIKVPDTEGSLNLFQQAPVPSTGDMPLVISGPLQDTGNMPLYQDGHRIFNTPVGRPPLYMAGMIPDTGGITLHVGRDSDSENMPLVVSGPIEDNENIPLYMLSPYNENLNLSMPNTKGQKTNNIPLVMFDTRSVLDMPLSISGPTEDNENTTLFTKYTPTNTNNIDDNPHNPCALTGPDYKLDRTSNSEQVIVGHNSIVDQVGFNELVGILGEGVRDSVSDAPNAGLFYGEDRIRTSYDSNGTIFAVADDNDGIAVYDVVNGSLYNKTILNLLANIDSNIYQPTAITKYKDLVVSDAGKIAFSLYVRYSNVFGGLSGREYIVILNTDLTVNTVINSEPSSPVGDFANVDKRIGDSLVWDGEDLYHSEQTEIFGRVVRRDSSDYNTKTVVAEFEDTPDFANYDSNLTYNENLKAGFGHKIVLTENRLVVSAPLLDPYLAQNTINSYVPYSPRGAVYLFNRSGDTFTYSEAVYANGLTDTTITPTSFLATTVDYDVRYFGYSIDYSDLSYKLIVGEPGYGSSSGNGGNGRVYTYDLRDSVSLLRTTDPTTVEDNSLLGLFVALCDGYTEFALSREANGKVYNINTGEEFTFDSSLTDDEVNQYIPELQTLISSTEEIQAMKLVSLGSDKLFVGRKFSYDYGFTSDEIFKLTALNSGKPSNLNLFLKAVEASNGNIPLVVTPSSPGYLSLTLPLLGDNKGMELTIKVPELDSGNMPLNMANTEIGYIPTYIKGLLEESTGQQDLFLKVVTPTTNSMALSYVHPYDPQYKLNMSIRAANPPQQWASPSLFIDEGTITRTPTDATNNVNLHALGDNGIKNIQKGFSLNIEGGNTGYVNARPTMYLEGQPSVEVDKYIPMYIEVDDPTGDSNDSINLSLYNSQTSGTATIKNKGTSLYVINSVPTTTNATLFLQRKGVGGGEELSGDTNLHINGPDADSNINLYTTAAFQNDGNMNLSIPETLGVPSGDRPLMVRGYEE